MLILFQFMNSESRICFCIVAVLSSEPNKFSIYIVPIFVFGTITSFDIVTFSVRNPFTVRYSSDFRVRNHNFF